jgi:hypothetical protein
MYVDLTKKEITKRPDGESEEKEEKYEKVFLAKVRGRQQGGEGGGEARRQPCARGCGRHPVQTRCR